MGVCEFTPLGTKAIVAYFECDKCKNKVESDEISLPSPNMAAEKPSDSHNDNFGDANCPVCGKHFYVTVYAGWGDAWVDIDDVDEDSITLDIIEDKEYMEYVTMMDEHVDSIISSNTQFIEQFANEITKLRELNNLLIDDGELQEALQRQTYSASITCLEDFLSTTMIEQTMNNEVYFKNFVQTYANIKKQRFDLNQIFNKLDQLNRIVKNELLDVIYHDLPKVREMYKNTFNIDFPEIRELTEIIGKRHDLVHRNGKNKKGQKTIISREVVEGVIDKVEEFATTIHQNIELQNIRDAFKNKVE